MAVLRPTRGFMAVITAADQYVAELCEGKTDCEENYKELKKQALMKFWKEDVASHEISLESTDNKPTNYHA